VAYTPIATRVDSMDKINIVMQSLRKISDSFKREVNLIIYTHMYISKPWVLCCSLHRAVEKVIEPHRAIEPIE
jgi:hypothetical protein